MRGRRRKMFIHKISSGNKEWVEGDENIAKAACDHFKHIFTRTEQPINEEILQHIPRNLEMILLVKLLKQRQKSFYGSKRYSSPYC